MPKKLWNNDLDDRIRRLFHALNGPASTRDFLIACQVGQGLTAAAVGQRRCVLGIKLDDPNACRGDPRSQKLLSGNQKGARSAA